MPTVGTAKSSKRRASWKAACRERWSASDREEEEYKRDASLEGDSTARLVMLDSVEKYVIMNQPRTTSLWQDNTAIVGHGHPSPSHKEKAPTTRFMETFL